MTDSATAPSPLSPRSGAAAYRPALTLLATLFFMWGFISVINNTLLPHLRSVFELNYLQTTLIESTWFIGYLLASIPSAKLIERIGYQRAVSPARGSCAISHRKRCWRSSLSARLSVRSSPAW